MATDSFKLHTLLNKLPCTNASLILLLHLVSFPRTFRCTWYSRTCPLTSCFLCICAVVVRPFYCVHWHATVREIWGHALLSDFILQGNFWEHFSIIMMHAKTFHSVLHSKFSPCKSLKKTTGSQSLSSYGQFALLKSINTCIYPIHLYVTWIKIESSNQETKVSRWLLNCKNESINDANNEWLSMWLLTHWKWSNQKFQKRAV